MRFWSQYRVLASRATHSVIKRLYACGSFHSMMIEHCTKASAPLMLFILLKKKKSVCPYMPPSFEVLHVRHTLFFSSCSPCYQYIRCNPQSQINAPNRDRTRDLNTHIRAHNNMSNTPPRDYMDNRTVSMHNNYVHVHIKTNKASYAHT